MCAPPRAQTRSLTFDRDAVGLLDACALAAFGALAQSLVARWIPCTRNFRAACIKRLAAGEEARLAEPGLRGLRTRGCTRRGVSTRVGRRQRPHAVASERARVWQRGGIPVCTVGVAARLVLVALVLLLELLAPDMNSAKLSVICFVRSPSWGCACAREAGICPRQLPASAVRGGASRRIRHETTNQLFLQVERRGDRGGISRCGHRPCSGGRGQEQQSDRGALPTWRPHRSAHRSAVCVASLF